MQSLIAFFLSFAAMARGQIAQGKKSLISFPGPKWLENNDPIMGGQSHGNWSMVNNEFGRFQGTVKNVSFLHAPGFCRAVTTSPMMLDASDYLGGGLLIAVRTTTPDYKGFRLSFGTVGAPRHHGGHEKEGSFKSGFTVGGSTPGQWQSIFLKFSDFSADWSDYTGECTTKDPDGFQHKCCTKASSEVCPNEKYLKGIISFNIWAEGVEGDFELDIKEIAATTTTESSSMMVV